MLNDKALKLTPVQKVFLAPSNPTHRRYEALRAFFIDGEPSAQVAARFGYSQGGFRVMCSQFRKQPNQEFFLRPRRGRKPAPKKDDTRLRIIELRKQSLSIYDIEAILKDEGKKMSSVMIWNILQQEGFSKLPRRADEERPKQGKVSVAAVADVGELDLSPRSFRTKFGGLFLFLPLLAEVPFDKIMRKAKLPGSTMIPAPHAMRSLLALKLFGNARNTHVMSYVFDEGMALFPGLNAIPKRSFLTEYSCRIHPSSYTTLMRMWFDAVNDLGIPRGVSFDLDFHTIPFHGEDALVEKHYVSNRSRRQKGILAFLAQDSQTRVFCYANAEVRKEDQNDEIMQFVEFWMKRTGRLPEELVFDSKLTTYANLNRLNNLHVRFITLRRRDDSALESLRQIPVSEWRRLQLSGVSRIYRTPRVLDTRITISDYDKPIRQIAIEDLGHDKPTLLLTNHMRMSATHLVERYAKRMLIENNIQDGIDFFHMDALSSAVAMKVSCDLQLTLMASSLYRLFAHKIGEGYENAKSRRIFRDFIDATAQISITHDEILVRFQKRAHNPLLLAAGFGQVDTPIPWLGNKRLRFLFS
jgi:transposase